MNSEKRNKPRLIQGVILKCVDGRWLDGDGLTPASEMLVVNTTRGLQCWQDKELLDEVIEMPGEPLPDADDLNAQIPVKEWRPGLDGKPQPPWRLNWVAYMVDTTSATRYTFLNSTTGARIAVERLEDRMMCMRALRSTNVFPLVKLTSRPMKTSYGQKMRPEFEVIDWRDLDGGGGAALLGRGGAGGGTPLIEHQKTEPAAPAKKNIGKSVKPVTISEEIDDGLPDDLAPPTNPLQAG